MIDNGQLSKTLMLSAHLQDECAIFFSLREGQAMPKMTRAPVSRKEIREAGDLLRRSFEPSRINFRRPERTANLKQADDVGRTLLGSLAEELDGCKSVVIASHRELHGLPLHLFGPPHRPPVGITHQVTYVPNLSIFAGLKNMRIDSLASPLCLSVAAREDSDTIHASFSSAPSVVASECDGQLFKGTEASRDRLYRTNRVPSLLYLSCHGRFDANSPIDSHLLLSDGKSLPSRRESESESETLSVRAVLERQSAYSPIVFLDACFSGVQNLVPGDEPLGFPAAFLISGSKAVVASNWIVEQNCARDFMVALTHAWVQDRVSLGEAMRCAYARVRESRPHPFHWAAFSLHGDHSVHWEDLRARTAN